MISSATCASVLAAYAVFGVALAWKNRAALLSGSVSATAALASAAFLLATHDLLPFTMALLALAAALEFQACCERATGARWLTAATTDFAVLLLSWILTCTAGIPEGYAAAPPAAAFAAQLALIVIYGGSVVAQTLVLRRTFTGLEVAQTAAAVLIGFGGACGLAADNPQCMFALGAAALLAGAACYVVSFVVVPPENRWNFRAWATFGLLLAVMGAFVPFSGSASWAFWCGCAIICSWAATAAGKPTVGLHGAVYMLLAGSLPER